MSDSSPPPPRSTRRTRIVCVSDTHNSTVKLPKGDVLIHSGDLTNQGSYSELSKAVQWLEKADFDAKIVIAGNHDITLDRNFYANHGSSFHNKNPQDPAKCLSLLTASPTITYLQHRSATIRLSRPDGPGTEFTVFGSPYSPEYGTWAFMYPRPDQGNAAVGSPNAAELWAAIPPDTDILVTHTPAYTHCDDSLGCRDLRAALARVRPRLHVCGHVHQARGAERVRWDADGLGAGDGIPAEASVERWEDPSPDPASAKISLVDLTARGGKRALDFRDPAPPRGAETGCGTSYLPDPAERVLSDREDGSGLVGPADRNGGPGSSLELGAQRESTGLPNPVDRSGRRETCVINCAIVATSWPHVGGRRFHKPIVVDLDLPVWR
ncbi:31c15647-f253-4987-8ff3-bb80dffa8805 [Thermothielavioides terrestris]|uniref:31c15647-f253-4987-8ff3-bb80dffa8805 n=1 Tax=Thermothielavioides terrestris TaxID=2587410 RepID=A0A446BFK6_9PEZI|nr:31c15647-f253-4987-8ff3-bb80dffa8805 [Thermothielavioides terrestris]